MVGMVDIHCHILPAVDDGSDSIPTSIEMLRRGAEEGIEIAVLTPHLHPHDDAGKEQLHRERFSELRQAVSQAGIGMQIHLGSEIGFRFGMAEVAGWPSGTLSGNGRFALIDLPPGALSPGLEQGFFEMRSAGFRPILAHPERHRQLAVSQEQIERLRAQELLFQVNAGSIMGQFGSRAQRTAQLLLEKGWADFVASDGHDLVKRPFSLARARDQVREMVGESEVRRLFRENPLKAVRGESVVTNADRQTSPRASYAKKGPGGLFGRLLGD